MHRCQWRSWTVFWLWWDQDITGETVNTVFPGWWARPLWRNRNIPRIWWWWGAHRDRVRRVPLLFLLRATAYCSACSLSVVSSSGGGGCGWWLETLVSSLDFLKAEALTTVKLALVYHLLSLLFLLFPVFFLPVCLSLSLFSSLSLPLPSPPSLSLPSSSRQGLTM